jgi:hypothetical protein
MREEKVSPVTAHRVAVFSDAVIAVIMTVMVLELKAPEHPGFAELVPLWPTVISYAVSYLFIAIIWINHHYLMSFVGYPTLRLIWINFAHLFMVSFLPFATAWVARTSSLRSRWRSTPRCSCASTLPTTSSSGRCCARHPPRRCRIARDAWRAADRSLSLRSSWPRRLWRSSRPALPSHWYAAP